MAQALAPAPTRTLPTGTVTFLITDIEGSTRLLMDLGEAYASVLERHNGILRDVVEAHGGTTVSTAGDSVFAVFPGAARAVRAAVAAQTAIGAEPWPGGFRVRVRMGLHTGEAVLGADDYVGLDVHRTARISAVAHGGQILLSAATAALSRTTGAIDLGEHRLKDLVNPEHLYQVSVPGARSDFPPLRTGGRGEVRLPVPAAGFVPRPEVATVLRLLDEHALVTLTGPGGTGKTRLALETALRSAERFDGGVVFVDLAPVGDPRLVPAAIISALGLQASGAPAVARLRAHFGNRRWLLLLDNFEQVLDGAAAAADLVAACPGMHLLVTSRAPLRVAAEQEFPVAPLALPGGDDLAALRDNPAVRLFVMRAARVRPGFVLTAGNAAAIAEIVRRLDGLPLALELAAARVRLLTPEVIAQRLASGGTADLASRDRDIPDRQRTLRSVIGSSYDLLGDSARRAFSRFSVFRGGARIEQIEEVLCTAGQDVVDLLETLVENSLVRRTDADGSVRFGMLATIAEHARERLEESGEAQAVHAGHADAYLALAEQAAPHLTGRAQGRWLDLLEHDHDNLRAAFDWSVARADADRAHRFTAALWRMWQIRGHLDEGADRAAAALRIPVDDPALRARALEAAGGIAWWRGDMERAMQVYDEALTILDGGDDLSATANARYNRALVLGSTSRTGEALAELDLALEEARLAGDRTVQAWARWGTCDVESMRGEWGRAVGPVEDSLAMFRELDDPFGIGWSLFMSATSLSHRAQRGDVELARSRFVEGAGLFAGFGDFTAITMYCWGMAYVEALEGRLERSLRLLGAGRGLRGRLGIGLLDLNEQIAGVFGASTEVLVGRSMAEDRARALVAQGERLSPDEAVAYLLERLDIDSQ
jgi:predicted ATPase/class 3 adenylate cyclase